MKQDIYKVKFYAEVEVPAKNYDEAINKADREWFGDNKEMSNMFMAKAEKTNKTIEE